MKKTLWLMLAACLMLTMVVGACAEEGGEEEGSRGTITFVNWDEVSTDEFVRELTADSAPFIPEDLEVEENQIVLADPKEMAEEDKLILGSDDRTTVKNTRKYPYSAIALMQVKYECGCTGQGTGYLVDSNKLLTAAHCMICTKHDRWADKITFNFGYLKGKGSAYKYTGGWWAHCGTSFPNGYYTDRYDWAYVRLDKNVGDKMGWFGRSYKSDRNLESSLYYVAGYRDGYLKYDFGRVAVQDDYTMWVYMDAVPGNSGCPIYDSDYYAVGIFTSNTETRNSAVRLTTTIKDYVNSH